MFSSKCPTPSLAGLVGANIRMDKLKMKASLSLLFHFCCYFQVCLTYCYVYGHYLALILKILYIYLEYPQFKVVLVTKQGHFGRWNEPANLLKNQVCLQPPVNYSIPSKSIQGLSVSNRVWSLSVSHCVPHAWIIVQAHQDLVWLMFCLGWHYVFIFYPKPQFCHPTNLL